MGIKSELKEIGLPPLRTREEMVEIMQREVYGYLPTCSCTVTADEPRLVEGRFALGTVKHTYVNLTLTLDNGSHTFRVDRLLHDDGERRPLIILNNIHPMMSSAYFPREEMSEYDADFLVFRYTDVTSDDGDFTTGLAPLLLPDGQAQPHTCGKIGIWAWAAMRVLDYGLTLPCADADNCAIVGHSRLGKTAAFCAMMDTRFKYAFSNAAGCTGDALARGSYSLRFPEEQQKRSERISDITSVFPYWFCKNYLKYAENNIPDGFDQHYMHAAIAPRYVMIGSCSLDFWADPPSQQRCALAASEAWQEQGLCGLVAPDRYFEVGEGSIDGHVGYFLIPSMHMLSRHGWRHFMSFVQRHRHDA